MTETKEYFYERNDYILNHEINKTFHDVLLMTTDEFKEWIIEMRKVVVYSWDELGLPPRVGFDRESIIKQFNRMSSFNVQSFEVKDEYAPETGPCVRNTSIVGNAVNQFFPTMMKTKINYDGKLDGLSIYDHFVDDKLLKKVFTYAARHFKRDSFYAYSRPIQPENNKEFLIASKTAIGWLTEFQKNKQFYPDYDFWIEKKDPEKVYTGYSSEKELDEYQSINFDSEDGVSSQTNTNIKTAIGTATFLRLSASELKKCIENKLVCDENITNVGEITDDFVYQIRLYKKSAKIFPLGLKAFRISWCQYAVNFPPLTAKYLYEKYTNHIKNQDVINLYDPSSGWGGRIAGAMSVDINRKIHYIGTDPNTDHWIPELNKTKYEYLADFFNENTYRGSNPLLDCTNTHDVYTLGSEVIHENEDFQKYKGKLDLVFTSPPYFGKEGYSEDDTQSFKKFPQYERWKDGFLRQTLTTAVEYLREDRYLLWNIADAKFGKDMLPLEKDSRDILENLGMKYIETIKMTLAQMPGGNRVDPETGLPKAKNFCKVNGIWLKYEPVFVFYKPKITK